MSRRITILDGIELKADEFSWEGSITLPAWAGYQERMGAYAGESSDEPSDGTMHLNIAVPEDESNFPSPPPGFKAKDPSEMTKEDAMQMMNFIQQMHKDAEAARAADDYDLPDPEPRLIEALKYFIDNQETIRDTIVDALLEKLALWHEYEDHYPHVPDVDTLKQHIGPGTLHVHADDQQPDEPAYVGIEFGCSWDDEHGFGVVTQAGKVLGMGHADQQR